MTPKENQKSVRSAGEASACGQRAGTLRWARGGEGCSDSPPPYLWTPPTPQQVKGCTPLTILKKWAAPEKTEDSRLFGVKIF